MRKNEQFSDDDLPPLLPLEDKTEPLTKRSKRTERAEKKNKLKAKKPKPQHRHLLDLPYELVLGILQFCRPSDIFNLGRVSREYHTVVTQDGDRLAKVICDFRYDCLQRCFQTPVLLKDVDPEVYPALHSMDRSELKMALKRPYQHVQPLDPNLICTCFICILRWTCLCIIPDFAHWQNDLDAGEPIPMIPRGTHPEWNKELVEKHAAIVRKALYSPLWHARLLEEHLKSTTRSISRHAANKGNKRRRFRMTKEDIDSGTDQFLARSGPPTADLPFIRDNYYMLEAFLPNRGWSSEGNRWNYVPKEQHDTDLNIAVAWAKWRAHNKART
ncbi:hypothetical protein JX266_007504 [Neoarthrinium moseri]|nr:hypothetical protein JX266_007504 [Neoarthrinium moseri]